jgi:hypothetical protein
MNMNTLYLAWQDRRKESRLWFPVGRLDVHTESPLYRFRYIRGAERARNEAGFPLLAEFPRLDEDYRSSELFPLFQNRIMNRARPDFADYLSGLDLPKGADPVEILAVSGGTRVTDAYEVFPKLVKREDGSFTCRFFLHGWRYVNQSAQERIGRLTKGQELYLTLELTNPTGLAVQIQTTDYSMIGWTPRYLVTDLVAAMAEVPKYSAHVVRVNPLPVPSKQRVLIEMRGRWDEHEPMEGSDFNPLV